MEITSNGVINVRVNSEIKKQQPSDELLEALQEADDIRNNPEKYPSYDNIEDLKKALLPDD